MTKPSACLIPLVIGVALSMDLAAHQAASEMSCFPTCEADGRFLVVKGNDTTTLEARQVIVGVSFPAAGSAGGGQVEIFDGDRDASRWDTGKAAPGAAAPELVLELSADPSGSGAGGPVLRTWAAGEIRFANGDWTRLEWPHAASALTPAGADQRYRYTLKISAAAPETDLGTNAFKIRTSGTLDLMPQAIGIIGAMVVPGDVETIYPKYPDLAGSPYDGTWRFRFRVPAGETSVTIFDGDLDYGDDACSIADTDDRDTTAIPPFGSGALEEGVASTGVQCPGGKGTSTGFPAEDNSSAAFRRSPTLPGSPNKGIVYKVVAPDGQTFLNRNPSGNREWEQFKILKVASVRGNACPVTGFADHDCETTTIPAGLWEVVVDGMDLSNLNFFHFPFRIER